MAAYCVLYNPCAGNQRGTDEAKKLTSLMADDALFYYDMTAITDYGKFFSAQPAERRLIVCGGDGTLNRFINDAYHDAEGREIFYFATGSGNDFLHDLGREKGSRPIAIDQYLQHLPVVTVKGKDYRFLNGIGYGIDGYCCEVGDAMRKKSEKPVNYAAIAIKGLLFHYKPTNATVTVDGKTHTYKKVWLAPTMNGRFYGGGMMPTPAQDRLSEAHTVSTMVLHGSGKLKTLMVFPSIFKGEHVLHTEMVEVLSGHQITVSFDRPTALQIDGETVLDVTEYTIKTAVTAQQLCAVPDGQAKKQAC